MASPFFMGSSGRFKGGLMVSGVVWAVTVTVWAVAASMPSVTASMWAGIASMWAVTASMHDAKVLYGLLYPLCGML